MVQEMKGSYFEKVICKLKLEMAFSKQKLQHIKKKKKDSEVKECGKSPNFSKPQVPLL